MGITKRVTGTPSGGKTPRVPFRLALEGDEAGGFLILEGDAQSGHDVLKLEGDAATIGGTATQRVSGAPSGGKTERVSGRPAGGATSRIQPFFLLLAGDQQSNGDGLLLAGDVQSGDDLLKLEGDQALSITSNITKRISL